MKHFIIFKVNSTLNICDSLIFGTTSPENNKNVTRYHLQNFGKTNKNKATTYYKITGLHPLTNFTFTANITDYLNNTKDQDQVIFSECTFNILEQQ